MRVSTQSDGGEPRKTRTGARPTPREAEVAGHVRLGKKNKDIGEEMGIDGRTVETHRAHVYSKLRVGNPAELDRFMRDMDL